jgi:hypothetical protein
MVVSISNIDIDLVYLVACRPQIVCTYRRVELIHYALLKMRMHLGRGIINVFVLLHCILHILRGN